LLIVEDDEVQRNSMMELIGNRDVVTTAVGTGQEALDMLEEKHFDCVVLDLGLPDMEGFEVLKQIKQQAKFQDLPVVIYTSKDLLKQEELQIKRYAETIITKDVTSPDRLLDETALFLHRVVAKMPEAKRKAVEQRYQAAEAANSAEIIRRAAMQEARSDVIASSQPVPTGELSGKKILVVDDDVRNIFALTGVLENQGMEVVFAENGRAGIDLLMSTPAIDLVLMDVMMPEMDGYETTRAIREIPGYETLPIIALTAKAMAGDREKCLEAGASDYITKPVDIDLLLSMMHAWMGRRDQITEGER
jgi:CheY-like chemotaxis protein